MDFSDVFLERREAGFTFGLANFGQDSKENMIVPYLSIDLGRDRKAIGDQLSYNGKMFLKAESAESGTLVYILHGDYMKAGMILDKNKGSRVAEELFFDFSATIKVDEKSHQMFQRRLQEIGFWVLCVQTSVDCYLIIDEASNDIKAIIEPENQIPQDILLN